MATLASFLHTTFTHWPHCLFCSHPMTPLHAPILWQSLIKWSLFDILSKFPFISTLFFQKCVQVCILPERLAKMCIILTLWPPLLWVFSRNDPFFEKKISHRKAPKRYCPSIHVPHNFRGECPHPEVPEGLKQRQLNSFYPRPRYR